MPVLRKEQLAFFVLHGKFPRARATDPEDYMRVRLIVWIVRRVVVGQNIGEDLEVQNKVMSWRQSKNIWSVRPERAE